MRQIRCNNTDSFSEKQNKQGDSCAIRLGMELTGHFTTRTINRSLYNIRELYHVNIRALFISVCNKLDAQNLFHNKFYFMPLHVSSTCAHHQEVKIALHSTLQV